MMRTLFLVIFVFVGLKVSASERCEQAFTNLSMKPFKSANHAIEFRERMMSLGSQLVLDQDIRLKEIDPLLPVLNEFTQRMVNDNRSDELKGLTVIVTPISEKLFDVDGKVFSISSLSSAAELLISLERHFGYSVTANERAVRVLDDYGFEVIGFSGKLSEEEIDRMTENFAGALRRLQELGDFRIKPDVPKYVYYANGSFYDNQLYRENVSHKGEKVEAIMLPRHTSQDSFYDILRNTQINSDHTVNAQVTRELAGIGFEVAGFARQLSEDEVRKMADRFLGAFRRVGEKGPYAVKTDVPRVVYFTRGSFYDGQLYRENVTYNGKKAEALMIPRSTSEDGLYDIVRNTLVDSEHTLNGSIERRFKARGLKVAGFSRELSEDQILSTAENFFEAWKKLNLSGKVALKDSVPERFFFAKGSYYDGNLRFEKVDGVNSVMLPRYISSDDAYDIMRNQWIDYSKLDL